MSPRALLASLVAVVLDRVAAPAVWRLALWSQAMHLRIVGRETGAPEGTGEPSEPTSPCGHGRVVVLTEHGVDDRGGCLACGRTFEINLATIPHGLRRVPWTAWLEVRTSIASGRPS